MQIGWGEGSSDFPIKSKILHTSVDETTVSSIEVLLNRAFLPVLKIGTHIAKIPSDSSTAKCFHRTEDVSRRFNDFSHDLRLRNVS
jgi:hypothetical protein